MPKRQSSKSKSKKLAEPQREQTLKELVQEVQERQDALEKKLDTVMSLLQQMSATPTKRANDRTEGRTLTSGQLPRPWNADLASHEQREWQNSGMQPWNPYNQPQRREYTQMPTDMSAAQSNPFDANPLSTGNTVDIKDPFDM